MAGYGRRQHKRDNHRGPPVSGFHKSDRERPPGGGLAVFRDGFDVFLKPFGEPPDSRIPTEGVVPACQQAVGITQCQRAHAGVVAMFQDESGSKFPLPPFPVEGFGKDLEFSEDDNAAVETQRFIEIGIEVGDDGILIVLVGGHFTQPRLGKSRVIGRSGQGCGRGHR